MKDRSQELFDHSVHDYSTSSRSTRMKIPRQAVKAKEEERLDQTMAFQLHVSRHLEA
jgi:hypothetical protein